MNRFLSTSAAMAAGLAVASAVAAQTLDVSLLDADPTVTQGTRVVDFMATLVNPSSAATIYLNGDSFTTGSPLLSVDDSPFFSNAPLALTPGESSGPIELFAVDLPANAPVGVYSGNTFSVLGGADNGAGTLFGDLGTLHYSINIAASTVSAPEIDSNCTFAALTLLVGAWAVTVGAKKAGERA